LFAPVVNEMSTFTVRDERLQAGVGLDALESA
jgi:hypothetical protein